MRVDKQDKEGSGQVDVPAPPLDTQASNVPAQPHHIDTAVGHAWGTGAGSGESQTNGGAAVVSVEKATL